MTQLTILKAELLKWEADLIGFKNTISSQAHIMDSEIREIEVELVPQGTLVERIRAAGAGIPAFFTPTGFGTAIAEGKESREFNGRGCILETALNADVAFIKAYKADKKGNLVFRKTARNFNPIMATAAKTTIVEVEEIVENGQLEADKIHTPSVYIDYLVKGENYAGRIEKRTNRK